MLNILKVKDVNPEKGRPKVGITYAKKVDGQDPDEYSFKSSDPPRDSFYDALKALTPYVCYMFEASDTWDQETIKVIGVSFSYSESGYFGVVVSAIKKVQVCNSPVVLNTPYHLFDPDSDFYDPKEEELFRVVQLEAIRYINGDRKNSQLDLFNVGDS